MDLVCAVVDFKMTVIKITLQNDLTLKGSFILTEIVFKFQPLIEKIGNPKQPHSLYFG